MLYTGRSERPREVLLYSYHQNRKSYFKPSHVIIYANFRQDTSHYRKFVVSVPLLVFLLILELSHQVVGNVYPGGGGQFMWSLNCGLQSYL